MIKLVQDTIDKDDIKSLIKWLEETKFNRKEFKHCKGNYDNLYLLINLYTAIYNSEKHGK